MIRTILFMSAIIYSGGSLGSQNPIFSTPANDTFERFDLPDSSTPRPIPSRFKYHEKIDPITDEDSSYILYSTRSERQGVSIDRKASHTSGANWGFRIACEFDEPRISFNIDYGYLNRTIALRNQFDPLLSNDPSRKTHNQERPNPAKAFIKNESELPVIYRIDDDVPVGYNDWPAEQQYFRVLVHVPNANSSQFLERITSTGKLAIRVKGSSVMTHVFHLNGLASEVSKLPCSNID